MEQHSEKYLVGLDLGTTHTVVAYTLADKSAGNMAIHVFPIEQLIAPGEVAARPLLPSVRYHPAEGELSDDDMSFSATADKAVIGEAARLLGSKTQGRFVSSAKSWLSHPSIDHTADILPWGSGNDVQKVSPLDASASYLAHVRTVWGHQFPDAPLEKQHVVITVPASFDEVARSLTLEAAKIAGLNQVRLLEEPQAVCYDWLRRHAQHINQALSQINLLLVCDVGGGTTDLTLIKVEQSGNNEPVLTRIGVGDHLMLGGDNIDLALAHLVESKLSGNRKKLSIADLSQLIEQCRLAKERLLADDAPEYCQVTLLGGGARLIGGTRSVQLTRDEVLRIALDGFFPLSGLADLPDKKRSGVVEFGLPYAAEPAISKHIAGFLNLHRQAAMQALSDSSIVPDGLLLNGGVFRSKPITQRLVQLLGSWSEKPPVLLENKHPELSVALGAVSYALARRDKKVRIGGGAARSYFLLIETPQASHQQGICVLPKGSEEGVEVVLEKQQFALRIGQPVQFHLTSVTGSYYQAGELVDIVPDKFHSLPPLMAAFKGETEGEIRVKLAITHTEIGTLKIQCLSVEDQTQRFDVEFQIRKKTGSLRQQPTSLPTTFNHAVCQIQAIFGSRSKNINPKSVKGLRSDLEKTLAIPRTEWDTPLLREIFHILFEGMKARRRSDCHERVWLSLVGYCLRPGFGFSLDDWRVEQIWKTYPQGIQFINERQNWTEWWTLWRRIAGGLDEAAQVQIFNDIGKFLNPAAARQAGVAKQLKIRGYDDMVRLVGVLERLPVAIKVEIGGWLLKRLQKSSEPNQTWWAVGRLAARVPFHGSSHNVIAAQQVEDWLQQALKVDWKKVPQAAFAATLMARISHDRARDLDEAMRAKIVEKLKISKSPSSWIDMVMVYKELDEKEEKQMFGEALPPGLKLI